jgi:trimethylamine---corrinoid protein Co-methyltransferase
MEARGMTKFTFSGQPMYRVLSEKQLETIHDKALWILENTGILFDSEDALKILQENGATVDFGRKIAKIPRQLVLDSIAKTPATVELFDRDGNHAITLGGNESFFAPASSPLHMLESDGVTVRSATAVDLQNISRVNHGLEHIKLQATAVDLHDIPETIGDSFRLYILLKNSSKPIITGAFSVHGVTDMRDMLAAVVGGEEALRKKPLAVFDVCSSAPLKWSEISCHNLIDCARFGLPIETISVPMPGATAPATLSASVLLHTVETLSGIVLTQCVRPGAPMIYGGAPMNFDMRFSTTSLNSVESGLITAAYAQMAKYYGMPCHTYAGLSDSKVIDVQAGLETGMSALLAVQAGVNVISGVGVTEFCNSFSLEKLVIDNDICGMSRRIAKGIDCSEEFLAVDLIHTLGPGGDFMSTDHTFKWFKKEPYIPSAIIDRKSRRVWEEAGSKTAFDIAAERVRKILDGPEPSPLGADTLAKLDKIVRRVMTSAGLTELPLGPKQ